MILNLINGAETYLNAVLPLVHIHDVAEAHIRAFEIPSAHGRYCLVESVVHHSESVKVLHKLYPTLQLPNKCADDRALAETYQVSKTRAQSLGIDYIPREVNLKDTVENLKEKKFFIAFKT
uniref:Cinnamoyl-CoA reductase n=1 Tax=Opuntia streptacantha TaxID=393608 RepID=A0A7C9AS17_OPUST